MFSIAWLWEPPKEIMEIVGMCRVTEQWRYPKDFLNGPQGRTVGIANRVGIAAPLAHRREHQHPNWSVAATFALIPGDEERPAILIRAGWPVPPGTAISRGHGCDPFYTGVRGDCPVGWWW